MNIRKHFITVMTHKYHVCRGCFKIGLYRQGILHDLSKFSPSEFLIGARYYQGNRSPNNAEREDVGYSSSWLHHKGRNKHHYEYWLDYSVKNIEGGMLPAPMPVVYILEMLMDRIAASKVYAKDSYTQHNPMEYYRPSAGECPLHPKTREILELLLEVLDRYGEEELFSFIRRSIMSRKGEWDDPHRWPMLVRKSRRHYRLERSCTH